MDEVNEIICAGTVKDLVAFIKVNAFSDNAIFLAEELPQGIVTNNERQNLLCFALLSEVKESDRRRYTSGRIFNENWELRWEKESETNYRVIYLGSRRALQGINKDKEELVQADQYKPETRCYYLFGKRLDPQQCERMQISPSANYYAEVRIPRLLRYQVSRELGKERVRLIVREYTDTETAQVRWCRFQDLKPAE